MKYLKALATIFVLFSSTAQAGLVTLQDYSPSLIHLGGILTFTYNDTTPDSISDANLDGVLPSNDVIQYGVYQNAIVSATFESTTGATSGKTFTLVLNSSNEIRVQRRNVHSKIIVNMLLSDGESTDIFSTYTTFGTTDNDSLSTILKPVDSLDDHYWEFLGDMQQFVGPTVVPTVPAPASIWLFSSGLIGLVAAVRQHKV